LVRILGFDAAGRGCGCVGSDRNSNQASYPKAR
jgi:hypothetical protein